MLKFAHDRAHITGAQSTPSALRTSCALRSVILVWAAAEHGCGWVWEGSLCNASCVWLPVMTIWRLCYSQYGPNILSSAPNGGRCACSSARHGKDPETFEQTWQRVNNQPAHCLLHHSLCTLSDAYNHSVAVTATGESDFAYNIKATLCNTPSTVSKGKMGRGTTSLAVPLRKSWANPAVPAELQGGEPPAFKALKFTE